jgi:hypothetical protein
MLRFFVVLDFPLQKADIHVVGRLGNKRASLSQQKANYSSDILFSATYSHEQDPVIIKDNTAVFPMKIHLGKSV